MVGFQSSSDIVRLAHESMSALRYSYYRYSSHF